MRPPVGHGASTTDARVNRWWLGEEYEQRCHALLKLGSEAGVAIADVPSA